MQAMAVMAGTGLVHAFHPGRRRRRFLRQKSHSVSRAEATLVVNRNALPASAPGDRRRYPHRVYRQGPARRIVAKLNAQQ